MTFALGANILLRSAEPTHRQYAEARDAVRSLNRRGHDLVIVPQNLYEFWAVATRPVANNGLGMTPAEAADLATGRTLDPTGRGDPVAAVGPDGRLVAVIQDSAGRARPKVVLA